MFFKPRGTASWRLSPAASRCCRMLERRLCSIGSISGHASARSGSGGCRRLPSVPVKPMMQAKGRWDFPGLVPLPLCVLNLRIVFAILKWPSIRMPCPFIKACTATKPSTRFWIKPPNAWRANKASALSSGKLRSMLRIRASGPLDPGCGPQCSGFFHQQYVAERKFPLVYQDQRNDLPKKTTSTTQEPWTEFKNHWDSYEDDFPFPKQKHVEIPAVPTVFGCNHLIDSKLNWKKTTESTPKILNAIEKNLSWDLTGSKVSRFVNFLFYSWQPVGKTLLKVKLLVGPTCKIPLNSKELRE